MIDSWKLEMVTSGDNIGGRLLHFDEADGTTTFADVSGKSWITYGGAVGDTDVAILGAGSLLISAATDYIDTAHSTDFDFGDSGWTFDFRVRFNVDPTTDSNSSIFFGELDDVGVGGDGFFCGYNDENIVFEYGIGGVSVWNFSSAWTPAINTNYAIRIVKSGSTPYIFIDGVSQVVTVNTALTSSTLPTLADSAFRIGCANIGENVFYNIDEFMYVPGYALSVDDYTPSVVEYTIADINRVDISSDVHPRIKADWGITDNKFFDRIASVGEMDLTLINTGGEYSPGHVSCTAGWGLNVPILLTLTFDSIDYK